MWEHSRDVGLGDNGDTGGIGAIGGGNGDTGTESTEGDTGGTGRGSLAVPGQGWGYRVGWRKLGVSQPTAPPFHSPPHAHHPALLFLQGTPPVPHRLPDWEGGLPRRASASPLPCLSFPLAVPQFPPMPPSNHPILLQRLPLHQPPASQPPQVQALVPSLHHQLGHGSAGGGRVL